MKQQSAFKTAFLLLAAFTLAMPTAAQFRSLNDVYAPPVYRDLEAWRSRAETLRNHLLISTGLWPMPDKQPLAPHVSNPVVCEGYSVQNVALETLPGFFLFGNLYRPTEGRGPFPAVLTAHGHWENGRLENTETASVPGRAINLARQGYVVFAYSMIGYNETEGVLPHRFDEARYQLWGFSAMGLQLWNSIRALDFVSALPDVDPERIGMTGASGGATQTFLLSAVDPRIRAAAPVNMISAHMQGGCVCENAPLLRLNATNIEIGALMAPRPLLMVSTSGDWTRNTPEKEFPALRAIYDLFDASGRVDNVHLDYPHNYNRESREAVYSWFSRWLLGREGPVQEQPFQAEPAAALLAAFPSEPAPLDTVFADFVEQAERQIERARPDNRADLARYVTVFGEAFRGLFLEAPPPAAPDMVMLEPDISAQPRSAVLIVVPRNGSAGRIETLARPYLGAGQLVFVLNPYAATDALIPPDSIDHGTTYNPTPAAQRVRAIRAAAFEILERHELLNLDLVGVGAAGPVALLARALLPMVRQTTIDFNHLQSGTDEAYLPDLFVPLLRRVGDFKTAVALAAPKPLTLKNMSPGPLSRWAQEVYRAAGATEKLVIR